MPPTPWPRLRDSWWVYALAGAAVLIFAASLAVEVRCAVDRCTGSLAERLFDLEAVGGVPRLFTTGLLAATAGLASLAGRRTSGRTRLWWTAVAGIGAAVAVAKLVSAHSASKATSATATLVGSVVLAVLALSVLAGTGRRWRIPEARPVTMALGVYAAAAVGLDLVTAVLIAEQDGIGPLGAVTATYGEEFGEAMGALLVLVTVRWHLPAGDPGVARLAPEVRSGISASRPHG